MRLYYHLLMLSRAAVSPVSEPTPQRL
jgi:hypothetical protein